MKFKEIITLSQEHYKSELFIQILDNSLMPYVIIDAENLFSYANFLLKNKDLYFDFLECITAIDNGIDKNTFDLVYNFYSIVYQHSFVVKVVVDRKQPKICSLSSIWKTANWHEREIFDLFGINFDNHPDMRRILNPEDWQGFPLRKDYQVQSDYHGIKVEY